MKGTVKAYSTSVNAGVIQGEDGKTYGFSQSEWHGKKLPKNDETVTFNGQTRTATKVAAEK